LKSQVRPKASWTTDLGSLLFTVRMMAITRAENTASKWSRIFSKVGWEVSGGKYHFRAMRHVPDYKHVCRPGGPEFSDLVVHIRSCVQAAKDRHAPQTLFQKSRAKAHCIFHSFQFQGVVAILLVGNFIANAFEAEMNEVSFSLWKFLKYCYALGSGLLARSPFFPKT
jgi:hypothetical protein